MKSLMFWAARAGGAAASLGLSLATAQPSDMAVADAKQPVPPLVYRSVFDTVTKTFEMGAVDWRAANARVGVHKRGHVDILKAEQAQAEKPRESASAAPQLRRAASERASAHRH